MNQVVIVDDDMIVRVTLRSLVNWEDFGFTVAADFHGGRPALEYLRSHPADLLITDMKMPDLDGISLIHTLRTEGRLPVVIALSGYNEFALVRQAFREGAFDYLLKSDLTQASLQELLKKLNRQIFPDSGPKKEDAFTGGERLNFRLEELEGAWGVALFEIDEVQKQTARFGEDLEEMLQKPVLELARQIPRIAARGHLAAVDPFHYVLAYRAGDPVQYRSTILSVVRQLQAVWMDFMNLPMSAAVSLPAEGDGLLQALELDSRLLYLAPLSGRRAVCTAWERQEELEVFLREETGLERLVSAWYGADQVVLSEERERFLSQLEELDFSQALSLCLILIALLARMFRRYSDDFFGLFPDDVDYREKLGRLSGKRELLIWMSNYFRWVADCMEKRRDSRSSDLILRAKRFLADNYANPELTLGIVADYVGLNEKYFSSRFTREAGCTFSAYLTELRMQKAKSLMGTTDLKMYEISQRVGYHNTEHFNRTFKKTFGQSPGDCRRAIREKV